MPAFLFLHSSKLTGSVIGASAPDLVGKVNENAITASIYREEPTEPTKPQPAVPLEERLGALTRRAPVMLFMKGNPEAPRCGFSRQIVELLQGEKVEQC